VIQKSPIEWTTHTSNPIKYRDRATGKIVWGCVRRSPGCAHCYAADLAKRYGKGGLFTEAEMAGYECFLDEKELKALLSPKRCPAGSKVFIGDMTDIFGPWVPFEFVDRVLAVGALRPDVTLMLLTKHPERMREYICEPNRNNIVHRVVDTIVADESSPLAKQRRWNLRRMAGAWLPLFRWPLANVWMGCSVENQRWLEVRGPELLKTPAAVRFFSCEPLLGALDPEIFSAFLYSGFTEPPHDDVVSWVIVGGESGPKARPFNIAWARSLVEQCQAAGVAVFVKQLGAKPYGRQSGVLSWPDYPLRDRKGGNVSEWPADLRLREFPEGPRGGQPCAQLACSAV
jgi:protein gp37